MIIGFDAKRIVRNRTGLGNYARTLVNDLAGIMTPDIMINLYAPDTGDDALRRRVREGARLKFVYPCGFWNKLLGSLWRIYGITEDLRRDNVKLFHGLSGELPAGIGKTGIKTVVTIHDIIFMRHPEWYNPLDRYIYSLKFRRTCREADRIIAISECTKRDIMLFGGVSPEKISVIYQSCSVRYKLCESEKKLRETRTSYMLPERYIVSVGTIEERKNILLAVKAMRLLPADVSLVVVGKPTPYADKVKAYIAGNGLGRRVLMLHDVPGDDLPSIYQMAEVCVYPSRYEGFGIPVVEAIQSGLPVVACKGSCLEEAGGNGGIYVDPDDVCGMAEAIRSVLKGSEDRDGRIAECMRYVARFENNNVARQVLDVYNEMLSES